MIREAVTRNVVAALPLAAMLIFMAVFAVALFFAARKRGAQIDHVAALPLHDGEESES